MPKATFFTAIVALIFCLSACSTSSALKKRDPIIDPLAKLAAGIDGVLADSSFSQSSAGIKIVSLKTGETLYSRNSQKLFHPASNMKLLTTATALKRLGLDFKFKTILFADSAAIADSAVNGNIFLKGYGNPDLTTDDLRWMVKELKSQGITRITGNLICDDSYLDDLYWGNGWMWDDVSDWEWAYISALTVNDNCVEVTVKPGAAIGDPLIVQMEPQTAFMQIENNGKTLAESDSLARKDFKVLRRWKKPENVIDINGGRFISDSPRHYTVNVVEDAALYCGTLFKELLLEEDIVFEGEITRGLAPKNGTILAKHFSPSIVDAIININKVSDNLSAELLLKIIGAEMRGIPGTAKNGISEIYSFFDEFGVDSTTYHLADGSGVSRYNVVHADLLIELLKTMHGSFQLQAEFKSSLPIAGIDGTIKHRMKETAAFNKLRAKTGTLRGVSCLSGYTATAEGEEIAFAILMEHFTGWASHIRKLQDRIGELISAFYRNQKAPESVKL